MAQGLKTYAQGQIRFDYLRLGTYYFQETKVPEGYNLDAATKKALAGAELQIIKIQEDGSELIVEEWTSKEEAHVVTGKLVPGEEYVLRETEAPFGYELAEDVKLPVNQ